MRFLSAAAPALIAAACHATQPYEDLRWTLLRAEAKGLELDRFLREERKYDAGTAKSILTRLEEESLTTERLLAQVFDVLAVPEQLVGFREPLRARAYDLAAVATRRFVPHYLSVSVDAISDELLHAVDLMTHHSAQKLRVSLTNAALTTLLEFLGPVGSVTVSWRLGPSLRLALESANSARAMLTRLAEDEAPRLIDEDKTTLLECVGRLLHAAVEIHREGGSDDPPMTRAAGQLRSAAEALSQLVKMFPTM